MHLTDVLKTGARRTKKKLYRGKKSTTEYSLIISVKKLRTLPENIHTAIGRTTHTGKHFLWYTTEKSVKFKNILSVLKEDQHLQSNDI